MGLWRLAACMLVLADPGVARADDAPSTLRVEVAESGWRVDADARPLGPSPMSADLPVTPGPHRVDFVRGSLRVERSVQLGPGETVRVTLPPSDRRRTARSVVGWGAVGLGALGLATSTAFIISSVLETDEATRLSGDDDPDAGARAALHRRLGDSRRATGQVTLAVGTAAVTAGILILWWGDDAPVPAVMVGPTAVSFEGRF